MQNRHLVQSRKQQSNMKPIIYCDLDGVLADFKTAAQRTTGMSINKWMNIPSSKEKWAPIKANKNFWSTLPWMAGGRQLWTYISKFDPHILSAYVEGSFDPNCIPGKTQWARSRLGIGSSKINLVTRKEKKLFAKRGQPAILIDDYEKNVREFTRSGGVGIHHTSTSKTISQLKKLGY